MMATIELMAGLRTDIATCRFRLRNGKRVVTLPSSVQARLHGEKLPITTEVTYRCKQPSTKLSTTRLRGLHSFRNHHHRQPVAVQAAVTAADGGMKELWEVAPKWKEYPVGRAVAGVAIMLLLDRAVAAAVKVTACPIPSPVLMLTALAAVMALGGNLAASLYDWMHPAISFFDRWMPLFFVPSIASIALAPLPAGVDLLRAVALLGTSYMASLFLSAFLARYVVSPLLSSPIFHLPSLSLLLPPPLGPSAPERERIHQALRRRRREREAGTPAVSDGEKAARLRDAAVMWAKTTASGGAKALVDAATKSDDKKVQKIAVTAASALSRAAEIIPPPVRPRAPVLPHSFPLLALTLAVACLAPPLLAAPSLAALTPQALTPGLIFLSMAFFTGAKSIPAGIRTWLGPTLAGGLAMSALMALFGSFHLASWRSGIRLYTAGAGSLLVMLIGPAVASLGFKVHSERELLRRSAADIALTCALMTPIQLAVVAAVGRMVSAPPLVLHSFLPAHTTLGLALETAPLLSASAGLVVAGVTIAGIAGISSAQALLDTWKISDPVSRGMAVGITSHSLGTSALVANEPQSAAVAGLSFALKGTLTVLLISVPAVRASVLSLAGTL